MARRHTPTRRVNPKPSIIPKPLEDGKARCPGCSAVIAVTKNGRLRKHRAPSGEDCAVATVVQPQFHLDELPPVVIPEQRTSGRKPPRRKTLDDLVPADAANGATYGECVDCGKWLPGERTVCGWCYVQRNASRR